MLIYFEHDNYYTEIDMPTYLFKYVGEYSEASTVKLLLHGYFNNWKNAKMYGKMDLNFLNYLNKETTDFIDMEFETLTTV